MITLPANLIVCSSPSTTITTPVLESAHDTLSFHHRSIPMQHHPDFKLNPMKASYDMNSNKSQQPYYDTMNMAPLEDSLLYTRDSNFNFSQIQQQQHVLPDGQRNWSERILQDIVGLLHILSPSGKILYCSESCMNLIGYHPQELIGKSLTDFLHTDDLDMLTRNLQLSFNTMTTIKIHYRVRKKDNTYLLLESIGQPRQDIPDQPPQSFFAIAQPYLSKSNDSLDSFLEMKMENEWLRKRLNDMMLNQGGSPISASTDVFHYQHQLSLQREYHLQQQQDTNPYISNNGNHELKNLGSSYYHHHFDGNHHCLGDRNSDTHNLNYQNNNNHDHHSNQNKINVQYYPPQSYPTTTTTQFDHSNDLLLGPSAQYYMSSNDSPKLSSRRPSTCSSTMFQTNNNNQNNSTSTDDTVNNNWNTVLEGRYNYSNNTPSVASSVEVNEMMARYQQEESSESLSAMNGNTGGLATSSSYLSSNNSTTTVNTDMNQKEKWKRRKKSRGGDDYVCADCGTTASPEWRKGPQGPKTLCNACGLRWAKKNKKI